MSERRDYVALDWVTGEIQETLTQATHALQAYILNRDDTTRLRFCLTHIHQVHGTLKMVEFFGAALLAEEMENLAQALAQGIIHDSHIDDALNALKNAIDQLPVYLERVKETRDSLPTALLPVLNDLRAVRGESLLSETVLFSPDMSASVITGDAAVLLVEGDELKEVVQKLRQMYQIALLGLIREQDVRKNVNYLAKVCARLVKLTATRALQPLWTVCIAVLEGLLNGSIDHSVAIKILLRRVDHQIKQILEQGAPALEQAPPEDLLKNLLYYVASCTANSRYIQEIKSQYNLDSSLMGGKSDSQAPADNLAIQAVMAALVQELDEIKTALSAAGTRTRALTDVLPLLRRVSDTMAILGMGSALKPVRESHTELATILATRDSISEDRVNTILQRITDVEADLNPGRAEEQETPDTQFFNDSQEAQEQLDGAFDSVIRECRSGLELTKEAIIEFVATQWNHNCLIDVPDLLTEIHGSLTMVPLERAALVIQSCKHYVQQVLLSARTVPEWQMLDTLADAITSIDYYLERLADDANESNETILDVAAESVAELGYAIDRPVEEQIPELNDDATPELESFTLDIDESLVDEIPVLAEVIPLHSAKTPENKQKPEPVETQNEHPAATDSEQDAEDDIDAEIIEIFIEEAGEVLETINEYLPQWIADNDDDEARATVRRAFHTLKGSGRMVNAVDIAELAWAVESMLNRVIDGSFTMNQARFDVVTAVKEQIPGMVSAFEQRQPVDQQLVEQLIEQAGALIKEQNPVISHPDASEPEHAGVVVTAETAPEETAGDAPVANDEVATPAGDKENSLEDTAIPAAFTENHEFDAELLDIFAAETTAHLQMLDDFIAHCQLLAGPADLTDELQRVLHTLKGSANMAGVTPVAELVTPVEYVVKELKIIQLKADAALVELLEQASGFIRNALEQLNSAPMQPLAGADAFVDKLMAYFKQRTDTAASSNMTQEFNVISLAQSQFLTDSLDQITMVNDALERWRPGAQSSDVFETIERALSQLIERAEAINIMPLAEMGQALQAFYRGAASDNNSQMPTEFFELAAKGSDALIDMLDQIAGHQSPEFDEQLLSDIQDYEYDIASLIESDSVAPSSHMQTTASQLQETGAGTQGDEAIIETVLEKTESDNEIKETSAQQTESDEDKEDFVELLSQDNELLDDVIEVDFTAIPEPVAADIVKAEAEAEFDSASARSNEQISDNSNKPERDVDVITEIMTNLADIASGEPAQANNLHAPISHAAQDDGDDKIDDEILDIFLEEADDLLEAIDESIHQWSDDREGREYLDDLQRILHTLKGGARLAQLTELGNLSHNFETFLIGAEKDTTVVDDAFLSEVQQFQDQLIAQVTAVKTGAVIEPATDKSAAEHSDNSAAGEAESRKVVTDTVLPKAQPGKKSQVEIVPFVAPTKAASGTQPAAPSVVDAAAKKGPQEVVKVSAQLLEELVNLAGETSISRGQAEEQISELVFSLEEMQITVERLQEQVRRLDMETEQQILYRQEQVESEGLEGFDPLEMDRYSALQQLSRSLLESSSDLTDIKSTLYDKARDMETLLIQQSRINTDLQEGLMRSRMVPFSRMAPRLRRIIRQVSSELNKKVDFKLYNIEGELDRTVLERMVAPLEHMLRNAVDHGLESPEEREAAGKPRKGTISLNLSREGGEIVLTLSDDGSGLDLDAVRNKAVERGLMEADANLSDREISQFILQSGFSTATVVTQLSGRGVGMDVVHSEIKQMGGSIDIESVQGQGTRFIVRLPFTVSVNRALMVSVDGDIYAIPLNTIEGIVRVSPFELEAYYQPEAPMFEYAGQPYLLRYMGALLRRGEKPMLDGQTMPLPVVLVRGADHSVAIQVDHLLGSREIVVKPLGPQFSLVQGLSGATVLGDGSVVVILDLLAMIRADASHLHKDYITAREAIDSETQVQTIMVVDDSVTVRKVTSRFLERQGMEVLLAKDGVDAMTQLQELERIPDVMLLDIEMPRMDGFEVASRVRHSSRMKDLPIIMITSRTGEKHRERALSLGVNYYMGKPYQETELLDTINSLVGITTE